MQPPVPALPSPRDPPAWCCGAAVTQHSLAGVHTWQCFRDGVEAVLGVAQPHCASGSKLVTAAATSILPKVMARLGAPCPAGSTGAGWWHPLEPGWGVWGRVEAALYGEWWDLDLHGCWQRVQGISLGVPDPSPAGPRSWAHCIPPGRRGRMVLPAPAPPSPHNTQGRGCIPIPRAPQALPFPSHGTGRSERALRVAAAHQQGPGAARLPHGQWALALVPGPRPPPPRTDHTRYTGLQSTLVEGN